MINITKDTKELRINLDECLTAIASKNENIVYLDADLMSSLKLDNFKKSFPDRAINCGIAEANMISMASAMSHLGFIPIVHTFGIFSTRRALDQIYISGGYSNADLIILGTDPGVSATMNGGTHMPLEDVAIMRAVPQTKIYEITDANMLKNLLPKIIAEKGIRYIRMPRKTKDIIYKEDVDFDGKPKLIKTGKDALIITSGVSVKDSLLAAEKLDAQGLETAVLNVYRLKPINDNDIAEHIKNYNVVLTVENHNVLGGLGSIISEIIAKNGLNVNFEIMGVQDRFGEVGTEDYLKEAFKISTDDIVDALTKLK